MFRSPLFVFSMPIMLNLSLSSPKKFHKVWRSVLSKFVKVLAFFSEDKTNLDTRRFLVSLFSFGGSYWVAKLRNPAEKKHMKGYKSFPKLNYFSGHCGYFLPVHRTHLIFKNSHLQARFLLTIRTLIYGHSPTFQLIPPKKRATASK